MDLTEVVARECIRDRIARYNHAGDSGKYQDMVECFTPDGALVIVGGERAEGHDALLEFFSGVRATRAVPTTLTCLRHCVTNTLIEVDDSGTARAQSYFQVVTDIGLDHWGRYRDHLVERGDHWYFQERSVKTDGYAPHSFFR